MTWRQDFCFIIMFAAVLPVGSIVLMHVFTDSKLLWPAAVLCSALACLVTAWHLVGLLHAAKPDALWAAMIVLMVPVYAALCWMTMLLNDFEMWCEVFESIYESFVVFSFLMLLNEQASCADPAEVQNQDDVKFWLVGQYVLLNLVSAFIFFYDAQLSESTTTLLAAGNLASCSCALAAVLALHREHDTGYLRDVCKFWCIKGVISTFCNQHILLLYGMKATSLAEYSIPASMERALICFELLPLALAHQWAYDVDGFSDAKCPRTHDAAACNSELACEVSYGATDDPTKPQLAEQHVRSVAPRNSVDGTYAVAFLGMFSGLLIAMYVSVLKEAEVAQAAASQADKCKWYYWLRYRKHCSPAYYRTEEWLQTQQELNHAIRVCLMGAFGLLFAASLVYVLFKKRVIHLHPNSESLLVRVATRFLCLFLVLVTVPLGWTAVQAMSAGAGEVPQEG